MKEWGKAGEKHSVDAYRPRKGARPFESLETSVVEGRKKNGGEKHTAVRRGEVSVAIGRKKMYTRV